MLFSHVIPDFPDFRDWVYQPSLVRLSERMESPSTPYILHQGNSKACAGFALAGVINHQLKEAGRDYRVSAWMAYEMARRHDAINDTSGNKGSTIRAALKGWGEVGVCREMLAPNDNALTGTDWVMTEPLRQDAEKTTVGAYYRVAPIMSHFHAAIVETGAILVSAATHPGWRYPKREGSIHVILHKPAPRRNLGHAFALVGYNERGFWVQNSAGNDWGEKGIALWTYEDWSENLWDAWAFRLNLVTSQLYPTPKSSTFTMGGPQQSSGDHRLPAPSPRWRDIQGHYIHIDDGRYKEHDKYYSNRDEMLRIVDRVASRPIRHLLLYLHGGLFNVKALARQIQNMRETFLKNRIYPLHLIHDTGLMEELQDNLFNARNRVEEINGGRDSLDQNRVIEHLLHRAGSRIWRQMKVNAESIYKDNHADTEVFSELLATLDNTTPRIKIHLLAHSQGAIYLAWLLKRFADYDVEISSCSLLAPACTNALFESHIYPTLEQKKKGLRINELAVYRLKGHLEKQDCVLSPAFYSRSLLYLVSESFERDNEGNWEKGELLGMRKYSKDIERLFQCNKFACYDSNGLSKGYTTSRSHMGFEKDRFTMNHVLKRITGKKNVIPFLENIANV